MVSSSVRFTRLVEVGQFVDRLEPASRQLCQVQQDLPEQFAPCDVGHKFVAADTASSGRLAQMFLAKPAQNQLRRHLMLDIQF